MQAAGDGRADAPPRPPALETGAGGRTSWFEALESSSSINIQARCGFSGCVATSDPCQQWLVACSAFVVGLLGCFLQLLAGLAAVWIGWIEA